MKKIEAIEKTLDELSIGDEFTRGDIQDQVSMLIPQTSRSLYTPVMHAIRRGRKTGEIEQIGRRHDGNSHQHLYRKTQVQHDNAVTAIIHPPMAVLVALGSLAVHIEEYLSKDGHPNDKIAIQSLLAGAELRAFLRDMDRLAFLPKKRNTA